MGTDVTTRRVADHFHVDRTAVMDRLDEELDRTGIAFLAAPFGYGKTTLLQDMMRVWRRRYGSDARIVSIDLQSAESLQFMASYREARAVGKAPAHAAWHALHAERDLGAEENESGGNALGQGDAASSNGHAQWRSRLPRSLRPDEPCAQAILSAVEDEALPWLQSCVQRSDDDSSKADAVHVLIAVDNMPEPREELTQEFLSAALRAWLRLGARILCTSLPSGTLAASQFPEALCLSSSDLAVGAGEYPLWERGLCLRGDDVLEVTCGIPLLLAACRLAKSGTPLVQCDALLGRAARIVASSLHEPAPRGADRIRRAIVMLGSGTLGDVHSLDIDVREDDVGELAEKYPHLGIDQAASTFACVPLRVRGYEGLFRQAIAAEPELAGRCVSFLLDEGCLRRAGALARLLPTASLVPLLADRPLDFVDLGLDDMVGRGLRQVDRRVQDDGSRAEGLAVLDALSSLLRDRKRLLVGDTERGRTSELHESSSGSEATRGLDLVEGLCAAWARATAGQRAATLDETARLRIPWGERDEWLSDSVTTLDLCELMARAAVRGDAPAVGRTRDALVARAAHLADPLRRLFVHHAALCDIMTCDFAHAIALLTPETTSDAGLTPSAGAGPTTITGALLTMDLALACLLTERPTNDTPAHGPLDDLGAARAFIERRGITLLKPFANLMEAVGLIACGREAQARSLLEEALASFGTRGNLFGQLACATGLALGCLTRTQRGQAQAFVAMASQLSRKLGARRLQELTDMFKTLAGLGEDLPSDQDRRLLETTLLESALRPRVSTPVELERAVLCAARGDGHGAQEILAGISQTMRPVDVRLACLAVRCAGPLREHLVGLLPSEMRRDLMAVDPQASQPALSPLDGRLGAAQRDGRGLSIRLFGGMQVTLNGHRIGEGEWGRQKARQLLAHLALYPERALPRERIARMLWPSAGDYAAARSGLYAALTTLRGTLGQKRGGPVFVLSVGDALRLDLELVDVDVRAFERLARTVLARRGSMPAADVLEVCARIEEIYGSGLNLDVDDLGMEGRLRSEEFEQLFVDCMVHASGVASDSGNPQLALWFARAGKRATPYREDVGLALMRALEALSRKGAAIDEYFEVAAHLREEIGVEPSEELRQAYAGLVAEGDADGEERAAREGTEAREAQTKVLPPVAIGSLLG